MVGRNYDDYFWNPTQDSIWAHLLAKLKTVVPAPTKLQLTQLIERLRLAALARSV